MWFANVASFAANFKDWSELAGLKKFVTRDDDAAASIEDLCFGVCECLSISDRPLISLCSKGTGFVHQELRDFVKVTLTRVSSHWLWLESSHSVKNVTRVVSPVFSTWLESSPIHQKSWLVSSRVIDSSHAITNSMLFQTVSANLFYNWNVNVVWDMPFAYSEPDRFSPDSVLNVLRSFFHRVCFHGDLCRMHFTSAWFRIRTGGIGKSW